MKLFLSGILISLLGATIYLFALKNLPAEGLLQSDKKIDSVLEVREIILPDEFIGINHAVHWFNANEVGLYAIERETYEKTFIIYNVKDDTYQKMSDRIVKFHCIHSINTIYSMEINDDGSYSAFEYTHDTNDHQPIDMSIYKKCKHGQSKKNTRITKKTGLLSRSSKTDGKLWVSILENGKGRNKIIVTDEEDTILKEWDIEEPIADFNTTPFLTYDRNINVFTIFPNYSGEIKKERQQQASGVPFIIIDLEKGLTKHIVPWESDLVKDSAYQGVLTKQGMIGLQYSKNEQSQISDKAGIYSQMSEWQQIHQSKSYPHSLLLSPDRCTGVWSERTHARDFAPRPLIVANLCNEVLE